MIKYEKFQEAVLEEVGAKGETWKHLLPAIPIGHRLRFLFTLGKGFSIPTSYDMIMLSQTLGEKAYEDFVKQAEEKKLGKVSFGNQISNVAS